MKLFSKVFLGLCVSCLSFYTHADLITTDPVVGVTTLDFESQPLETSVSGPIQVGTPAGLDIEFTGNPNTGLYVTTAWGLVDNGNWSGIRFLGANDARPGSMIIAFNDGPVATVGGFINHGPNRGPDLIISALDASMGVIETHNITTDAPIVTPGETNGGEFRGITRPTPDIYYFEIYGEFPVMDYMTFSDSGVVPPVPGGPSQPVPGLSSLSTVLLALVLLLVALPLVHRRKQSN